MLAGFDFLCNAGTDKDRDGTRIIVFYSLAAGHHRGNRIGDAVSKGRSMTLDRCHKAGQQELVKSFWSPCSTFPRIPQLLK